VACQLLGRRNCFCITASPYFKMTIHTPHASRHRGSHRSANLHLSCFHQRSHVPVTSIRGPIT
jgi:hypothetical protein